MGNVCCVSRSSNDQTLEDVATTAVATKRMPTCSYQASADDLTGDQDSIDKEEEAPVTKSFVNFADFKGLKHVEDIKSKYKIGKVLGKG